MTRGHAWPPPFSPFHMVLHASTACPSPLGPLPTSYLHCRPCWRCPAVSTRLASSRFNPPRGPRRWWSLAITTGRLLPCTADRLVTRGGSRGACAQISCMYAPPTGRRAYRFADPLVLFAFFGFRGMGYIQLPVDGICVLQAAQGSLSPPSPALRWQQTRGAASGASILCVGCLLPTRSVPPGVFPAFIPGASVGAAGEKGWSNQLPIWGRCMPDWKT